VMGRGTTITSARGRELTSPSGIRTFVTVHPSAILRMPDRALRQKEMERFVGDLRRAAHALS
jgi:uracil-DNA glycosylase